jgi:hypothetical protein
MRRRGRGRSGHAGKADDGSYEQDPSRAHALIMAISDKRV